MISRRLRNLSAPLFFAVALLSFFTVYSEEPAGSSRETSPQESAAEQDSLFARINERFQAVRPMLERSCFDCHSQSTKYPWYHKLPLIGGMMDDHISEGREHLDMTEGFPFKGKEDGLTLLREIKEEIEDDEMPLLSYRLLHWGRLIEGKQRDSLFAWIDETTVSVNSFRESVASDSTSQIENDD